MRGNAGFRKCRRCGERHRYPEEFTTTRNGTVSAVCAGCDGGRLCEECGKYRRAPDHIRPTGRKCFDCLSAIRKERKRAYYLKNREKEIARANAWNAAHPAKKREHDLTHYRRVREDPDRYGEILVRERMNARLRGAVQGDVLQPKAVDCYVPPARGNHSGCQLPTEPLREWLLSAFKGWMITEIADYVGVDDSHLGKIISGKQKLVSEYVADKIFVGADCTYMLALLYPLEEAA